MAETVKEIKTVLKIILAIMLLPIFWMISLWQVIWPAAEKEVKGSVVLITGAANGLGKETARQFAQKGSIVVCVDMKAKDLEEAVKMIKEDTKGEAEVYSFVCDISDRQAVYKLSEDVLKKFGRVDILVNNAAALYGSTLTGAKDEDIIRVVNINILGQCWMTRAFLPSMQERNEGHIVFISSIAAFLQLCGFNIYCMTKAALSGFMLSLKEELEQNPKWSNINITGIHPSFMNTNPLVERTVRINTTIISCANAARSVISAIRRNRFEVGLPGNEFTITALYIYRLMPRIFQKMVLSAAEIHVAEPSDTTLYSRYHSPESLCNLKNELDYTAKDFFIFRK